LVRVKTRSRAEAGKEGGAVRAAGRVSADELRAPLAIDGSHGEGGGQILRTALALSAATGRPVRLFNIRAGRAKPGLAAQHLTAIRAAAALCGANVEGDALSSQALTFTPCRPVEAGTYRFDVADARVGGSAGSATLVLQTVLVPLD
jgi:RNA 3'-terminal phosphate cyclase (ATP)